MSTKTWFTADWHLGEDRFEIMGRPDFSTREQMIDLIVNEHNARVAPDDIVYMNGDVCYQKAPEYLNHVSRFNGDLRLIRGNHDRVFTDEQLAPYFTQIIPEGEGVELDIEGIPCYITHYPTLARQDRFNLTGHIHSAWKYQLNMLNVGVDVHFFRPVAASSIPFHLKAITEFYDMDVWVAYEETNASYRETRGKKSQYFTPEAK